MAPVMEFFTHCCMVKVEISEIMLMYDCFGCFLLSILQNTVQFKICLIRAFAKYFLR